MEKTLNQHTDLKNWYISNFDIFESRLNGHGAIPFQSTRRKAISNFSELGFPSTREEEWKYTNLAPILKHRFKLSAEVAAVDPAVIPGLQFRGAKENLLVFIDGHFSKNLSVKASGANGLVMDSLANVLHNAELTDKHLARYANFEKDTFVALNTAFANEGVFIRVPRQAVIEEPIHVLYLTASHEYSFVAHPRNLILIGEGSQVQIIEHYHSLGNHAYFNNVVGEIVVENNAVVHHLRLQNESRHAYHVGTREVSIGKDSAYTSVSVDLGGALVRNNIHLRLNGENSEGSLYGFYFGRGEQLIDNHTLIEHAKPHCPSNEFYKGILDDRAHGVFNGKVMVRPDAQKTNAYQSNKCLLLSNDAVINTKPQLEIFADDVKCSHGASVGQLDEESVFYLRSRGIGEDEANAMLRHAYAGDILGHIADETVRAKIDDMVQAIFLNA